MKKTLFILTTIFNLSLFANSYYALLEPVETYNIKANASGQIVFVNRNIEGKIADDKPIILIDDKINKEELKYLNEKIDIVKDMLKIDQDNYNTIKKLSTKSKFEKDNAKMKILNIKSNLNDLKTKKLFLKDKINNKTITSQNNYIYKIMVNDGDFVNFGSPLLIAKKISKAKLTIYLGYDSIKDIKDKEISLNDKKTNLKIDKIFAIADEQKISSYKCEIIVDNPLSFGGFSQLFKIDFKDKKDKNDEK
jgi:hypothetical protein